MKRVTKEHIEQILDDSELEVIHRVFDKQCVIVAKLPNGFTLTGTSAVVDPENYDEEIGRKIALRRIKDKIGELEGYLLHNK